MAPPKGPVTRSARAPRRRARRSPDRRASSSGARPRAKPPSRACRSRAGRPARPRGARRARRRETARDRCRGGEPIAHVLGGVVDGGRRENEAVVNPREQRAVRSSRQARLELREPDEYEGQQRLRVPLVIHQDVEVGEHVRVEQVRLVEEKDRVHFVAPQFVHVRFDGEEEIGRGGRRVQAEAMAEVAIEVAPAEGRVSAIGQPEAGLRQASAQRPQHARLTDAGLAEQHHALPLGERLLDLGDESGLRLRQPQVLVADLLREGRRAKAEARQIRRARHRRPPRLPRSACGRDRNRRALSVARAWLVAAVVPSCRCSPGRRSAAGPACRRARSRASYRRKGASRS